MKAPLRKIGIPGIAVAIFAGILLLLSFYFFYKIGNNRQVIEEQGFRELNQLGVAMKAQDDLIRDMVSNYSLRIIKEVSKAKDKKSEPPQGQSPSKKESLSLYMFEKSPVTKNIFFGIDTAGNATDSLVYYVTDKIKCKISYPNFITPFIRQDFFSDFILIREGEIVFSTTEGDLFITNNGKAKSEILTALSSQSFSAKSSDSGYNKFIQSGTIHKVKLQGTKYELFLTPVKFHAKDTSIWFVGGFIPEEKISAWERGLPSNWIIITFIVLLIILFSLPVMKIYIAGANEKITRLLVTMVGISIVIGTFLIVIFITDMLIELKTKAETDRNLKKLDTTIQETFLRERTAILKQLFTYNSIGKRKEQVKTDSIKSLLFENDPIYKPDYRFFKTMFWANNEGKQTFFITPYSNTSSSYVGYRNYFKNPEVYEDSIEKTPFWYNMEPIYSNTSGEWVLAFSSPAKDQEKDKIVAMTSWMYSVKSTILPKDFEYCLVEKSGRIWYHSNEIFTLSDDFLKECDDNHLNAIFRSNSEDLLYITLRNTRYRINVSPVSNTNLFLVTMFNPAKIKSIEAITAGSAIVYFGLIALILLIFFSLLRLLSMKNKLIEGNDYFLDWLMPIEKKKKIYAFLLVINTLLAVVLLIISLSGFIRDISITWVLWGLLFVILGVFTFNYMLIDLLPFQNPGNGPIKTKFIKTLDNFLEPPTGYFYKLSQKLTFYSDVRNLYASYMVSWILITTVIPAILFMARFHHEETKHYIINQFQGIADKLNHRTDSLAKFYKENIPLKYPDLLFYQRNLKGHYFTSIWNTTLNNSSDCKIAGCTQDDNVVVHQVHYFFNKLTGDRGTSGTNPLIESKINMTDSSFGIIFKGQTLEYPVCPKINLQILPKGITIQGISTPTKGGSGVFKLFDPDWITWVFFAVMTLILLLIHLLIRKVSHKLFDFKGLLGSVPTLKTQLVHLGSTDWNAIIISLNDLNLNDPPDPDWKLIDMNDSKSLENDQPEKLILCNIESTLSNPQEIIQSVKTLEKFLKRKHVVLFLNTTPEQIVDGFLERWKTAIVANKENEVEKISLFKLEEGLNYFQKAIYGLPVFFVKPLPWKNSYREPLKDILKRESIINPDIKKYAEVLNSVTSKTNLEEEIILKLQELSITRYSYIWNRLSKEEHFILYQFANGAMLNLNNKEPIRLLFNKGILVMDEHVEIVSAAFKNFILTSIDLTDIVLLEKQSMKTGNWSRFRLPVMLMAASIVVFLFSTQQSVLSNLNAIMLSVATLLGVYLKFSGLFVPGNK